MSASVHDQGHVALRPTRMKRHLSLFTSIALAGTIAFVVGLFAAGSASADPLPNTQQCVTTAHGDLCSTPSVDNTAGTVTITNHATGLTTNPVQAHLTAGSYTAGDFTTEQNPAGTYDNSFTFTPPAGVTTATVELTGPTGHSFDPAIIVTVAWEFTSTTGSSLNYSGQGIPLNVQCDANNTPYLLFIFAYGGNYSPTDVTLHGITVTSQEENGNETHFTTAYADPSSLIDKVYVTWNGDVGNAQLVISHGCAGTPSSSTPPPSSTPPKSSSTPPPPPTTVTDNCPQFCSTATSTHHKPSSSSSVFTPGPGGTGDASGRNSLVAIALALALGGLATLITSRRRGTHRA